MNRTRRFCTLSAKAWSHRWALFPLLILIAVMTQTSTAHGQDIPSLVQSNDVEILAWVGEQPKKESERSEKPSFSVNEQIILSIEVATKRWFTRGTRIGSVEIANVIAKQRNQLATNFTQRKGRDTWSRQRWEITLYPQASGRYVIPPIAVNIQVSAPNGENVSGTLYTEPIEFDAKLPSGLLGSDSVWFSASDVDTNQEWTLSNEDLKVGDAITRTITIKAQDSLSVLLPNLLTNESNESYQAYPQPHRLDDTQTRGDYQSSRIEESVYVIQQGGEFSLPELKFQWWNSEKGELESVVLEGKTYKARHTFKSFTKAYSAWFFAVITGLLALVIAWVAVRRFYRNRPTPAWVVFRRLLKAKRWGAIRAALYKQLRINVNELEMRSAVDSPSWQQRSQRMQEGEESHALMKSLWRSIQSMQASRLTLSVPKALPELDEHRKSRKK